MQNVLSNSKSLLKSFYRAIVILFRLFLLEISFESLLASEFPNNDTEYQTKRKQLIRFKISSTIGVVSFCNNKFYAIEYEFKVFEFKTPFFLFLERKLLLLLLNIIHNLNIIECYFVPLLLQRPRYATIHR